MRTWFVNWKKIKFVWVEARTKAMVLEIPLINGIA